MAPLPRAMGSSTGNAGFTSINVSSTTSSFLNGSALNMGPPRPPTSNEPEIIEIDDDDEEDGGEEESNAETTEESYEDDDEEMQDGDDSEKSENGHEGVNGTDAVMENPVQASAGSDREMTTPELFTSAGARQALHPLRRTADRVTRQIEAFSEQLDQFKQKENRVDNFGKYQAAWALAKSYRSFAQDAVREISKQQTLKRAKSGWMAGRSNGTVSQDGGADQKIEEEVKRLQLEADTWYLLQELLAIDDPARQAHAQQAQETAFQRLHRYSSDRQIWNRFIEADNYAAECVVAMKWLEHTARNSSHEIDSLIAELEAQAERGQGLWAHGWLYTKESIKGQKRLRAWPQPLEPNDPGITLSLLSSEKQEPLITQLDPDAIIRQKQRLQKQDQFYERATWVTCWKMLRRGESWTKIREWARERLENWRAISLCGSSVDGRKGEKPSDERTPADDGMTRMMNSRSQGSWRAACSALARNPNAEEFERAVYALLCGETEPAYKVCQSWEDYLYVYFNKVLLSRYQGFCQQLQRKLSHSPTSPVAFVPKPAEYDELQQVLQQTRGMEKIGVEARNPFRTIQAAILGKAYDNFFTSLARAVSKVAVSKPEPVSFMPDLSPSSRVDDSMVIAAEDNDALRIATHLYAIANSLGYDAQDPQFLGTASVIVMGYIANLEEAGLYDLIPSYASLLEAPTDHVVLAHILLEIVDPREKKKLVRLIEKHGIDMEAVLKNQWSWVHAHVSEIDESRAVKHYPKIIRRKDGLAELAPVKKDFIGSFVSPEDEQLIRSLEWHRYVDGQWAEICSHGALLYKKFYLNGKLSAARELSRRMNLSDVSREAFGFELSEFPIPEQDETEGESQQITSAKKSMLKPNGVFSGTGQSIIKQQAQTMQDLEQLIVAFDALETFAVTWEEFSKNKHRRDSSAVQDLKERLEDSLNYVMESTNPMLGEWLRSPRDENEYAELEEIRVRYIPELLLEFHSALYFAAHGLSSDILVQTLNLANQVASNQLLTDSFVEARRMAELVDALAVSSKAMLGVSSKTKKKLANGETLSIWNVETEHSDDDLSPQAK